MRIENEVILVGVYLEWYSNDFPAKPGGSGTPIRWRSVAGTSATLPDTAMEPGEIP